MRLSPDLFNSVTPPEVWVHITTTTLDAPDERSLIIRLKCVGRRSVSLTHVLDRYCPEDSVLRAASDFMAQVSNSQVDLSRPDLLDLLHRSVVRWVEPF